MSTQGGEDEWKDQTKHQDTDLKNSENLKAHKKKLRKN
jgi:hypothetical protein